ncbi:MAG: TrkH family potassium uptake protein [Methanomicrobiales archaeon]|nr:TrkH family potassium uptake protein [Methanomicrobiales archaeon]
MIANDIGSIFELVGLAAFAPFAVLTIYQEWEMILPMASAPFSFVLLGYLLRRIPRGNHAPHLSIALATAALAWFAIALVGSLPFILGLQMTFTDSVFEAMSGWTTTGFTMMTSLDTAPRTLIFWRSFMQWMGGIGVIAFTVTMQTASGLARSRLFRSEGRPEAFMPSAVSTGRRLWGIYAVLTLLFIGLVMLAGLPLWDATNLVMSTLSTGGFTVHDAGIRFYDNAALEGVLVLVMIAGALPFKIYYLFSVKRQFGIFRDAVVLLFLSLALTASAIVSLDLYLTDGYTLFRAVREGIFIAVSGITCTGLQNSDLNLWAAAPLILVIMLMFIGGAAGSTAGGIKVNRLVLAYEALVWWFKRFFVGRRVIVPFRYEGRILPKDVSELEISKNMLIVVLWALTLVLSLMLVLHLYATPYTPYEVLFEHASAMSNVGLSVGFMTPASPAANKWIFILLMWIGRLEILPVIVLIVGLLRGFETTVAR